MPAAFVQLVSNDQTPSTATLDTSATPITVTAHNSLVGCSSHGSAGTTNTFASNLGSVFTKLGVGVILGQELDFWLCQDAVGGSDFFTAHANSGTNVQGLIVSEISGCVTSGGYGFIALGQNGPGVGANSVTSGLLPVAFVPSFLVGFSNNRSANGFPLVGTSPIAYTDRGNFWPTIGGGARGRLEDFRQVTAGSWAATFDPNGHTGSLFISGLVSLSEIGAVPSNQVSKISSFNLGPEPQSPFNLNQFHPFSYQANYNPVPLAMNLDPAFFAFNGQNMTLSAVAQATLLMNPGLFSVNGLPITFVLGPVAGVLFGTTGRYGGRVVLTAKRQGETVGYAVDFLSSLAPGETITSAVVTSLTYTGTDVIPNSIILGPATFQGSIVNQGIVGGVAGNIYSLLYKVHTSLGQVLEITAYLAVITDTM